MKDCLEVNDSAFAIEGIQNIARRLVESIGGREEMGRVKGGFVIEERVPHLNKSGEYIGAVE